jgi:hypothetical protein
MLNRGRASKQGRYRRALGWSAVLITLALILPLIPYALAQTGGVQLNNPGVELWSAVRERVNEPMTTQVQGVQANQLINYWGD